MAFILQTKPHYRPRGIVSIFLMQGRLVARAWRQPGGDPKSARQLAQRSRLACASRFLKHFTSIVQHGYKSGEKPNGRAVGAYQMALSHVMREGTTHQGARWSIKYPAVRLAQGKPFPLKKLVATQANGHLVAHWKGKAPKNAATMRMVVYHENKGTIVNAQCRLGNGLQAIQLMLPKGLGTARLHVWAVLEDADGNMLWESAYCGAVAVHIILVTSVINGYTSVGKPPKNALGSGWP